MVCQREGSFILARQATKEMEAVVSWGRVPPLTMALPLKADCSNWTPAGCLEQGRAAAGLGGAEALHLHLHLQLRTAAASCFLLWTGVVCHVLYGTC